MRITTWSGRGSPARTDRSAVPAAPAGDAVSPSTTAVVAATIRAIRTATSHRAVAGVTDAAWEKVTTGTDCGAHQTDGRRSLGPYYLAAFRAGAALRVAVVLAGAALAVAVFRTGVAAARVVFAGAFFAGALAAVLVAVLVAVFAA